MLEMLEKYGQGFILYLGWFLGDNRKNAKIQPLNLLDDERLLICSLICLVGGLSLYYLLLQGQIFISLGQKQLDDFAADAIGKRLAAWAGAIFLANVLAALFRIRGRVLDVTSAILRVTPIIALMNTVFGFEVLQIVGLFGQGVAYNRLIMVTAMCLFALVGNLIALPRSLALVPDASVLWSRATGFAISLLILIIDCGTVIASFKLKN